MCLCSCRAPLIAAVLALGLLCPLSLAAQGLEPLDSPLAQANMCGSGQPGAVHFTLAATGDTFPHENIQAVGEAQGYDVLFDYLRPFLQSADLAYTNFDGAMLAESAYTGYPNFNFNPALAPALKNAGIDVVSTANNHILDRGPEGLDATLAVLEQAGIAQHGTVRSDATERPPYLGLTLSRDGVSIKLAFLSFTWGTNGIPDPYGQVNLLWQSDSYGSQGGVRQEVLDAVAQARREADLVVVAAHWGEEYQFYPQPYQVEGAQALAAAGADVILGAQPHTLQPVELIEQNGRQTLVIYSLANFLASQGAFQAQFFSATSVIFYVGVVREPDGRVRVTGYRYLPTIHVDDDTRPAPIPGEGFEEVIAHVRQKMRDPAGLRQLSPDPTAVGAQVEVCSPLRFGETPLTIGGDFAQHVRTLGGTTPRSPAEQIAVFGLPLGPASSDLAGDCTTTLSVLTTERQRLELHAANTWPTRVIGSQIGVAVYRQNYPGSEVQRRTDLTLPEAFADERFRRFFESYGGLAVFGYPISGLLEEQDAASGRRRSVQYFERARFELQTDAPADANLLSQVQLGALGREYAIGAAHCELSTNSDASSAAPLQRPPAASVATVPPGRTASFWIGVLGGVVLLLLGGLASWRFTRRRTLRPRRLSARERVRLRNQARAQSQRDPEALLAELLSHDPDTRQKRR